MNSNTENQIETIKDEFLQELNMEELDIANELVAGGDTNHICIIIRF